MREGNMCRVRKGGNMIPRILRVWDHKEPATADRKCAAERARCEGKPKP